MVELAGHRFGIRLPLPIVLGVHVKALSITRISDVRLNGGPDLAMIERLPVDAMEERMGFDLLGTAANVSQSP